MKKSLFKRKRDNMDNTFKTNVPCDCGEHKLIVTNDIVGYMGDAPCYESYGECPTCHKKITQSGITKRFNSKDLVISS